MKKLISAILILVLAVFPLSISVSANGQDAEVQLSENQEMIRYSDGSYAIITLSEEFINRATKNGSKSYNFYGANGVLGWTVTLNGTFSYDGSSASCTSSSVSHAIYDSVWKVTSQAASRSGAAAIGDFTVKRYTLLIPVQTETVKLTITCSPSGTLS